MTQTTKDVMKNDPELKRFETTMSERYGRDVKLRSIPLKEFVSAATGLLEQKISDLVLEGSVDEAGYWRDIVHLHPMQGEKEIVPIFSSRDFIVRRGQFSKAGKEESGGKVGTVTLDVSNEDKERYVYLAIRQRDIELKKLSSIEDSVRTSGRAFAKYIRDEILTKYLADKGTDVEQAKSTDTYFAAIMKLASKMNKKGFGLDCIIIDSDDFVQAITEQAGTAGPLPWLTAMMAGPSLGENFAKSVGRLNGLVGLFAGTIPIYVVGDTSASLNGTILGIEKGKGEVFGLHKDITVVDRLDTIEDLREAKISARYDIALGNASAIGWVSGA